MTMTSGEMEMLHSYLDSSHNYLEFGSGKSTIYASTSPSIKTIDSVESSELHINSNLKSNAAIANALSTGKLVFHIIDIGETSRWGDPKNKSKKYLWPNYSFCVFSKKSNHDLILVDGRFRVACTLNCALYAPENCTILIHDFWSRPQYHVVLKYLELKEKVDTLGVFRKKQAPDPCELEPLIKKFQYLPRDLTFAGKLKERLTRQFRNRQETP